MTANDSPDGDLPSGEDPLARYVAAHAGRALEGLRGAADGPTVETVHDTRTSLRRLRATLRSFPSSFAVPASLEHQLRQVALAFGEVRDTDVLTAQLLPALDDLPGIDSAARRAAHTELAAALASDREQAAADLALATGAGWWRHAEGQLEQWSAAPPSLVGTEHAAVLDRGRERVRDRLHRAEGSVQALHSARKAAKRWRYAAELLEGVEPAAAAHYAEATEVHVRLGELQDAVVARQYLQEFLRRRPGRMTATDPVHLLLQRTEQRITDALARTPQLP